MSLATAIVDRLKAGSGQAPPAAMPVRASSPAIPFHPTYSQSFGPGIGNQPSHAVLLQENIGVPDIATRAIANRISSLVPLVKVSRRLRPGTIVDEILDDHPLKSLLDRPHPDLSRMQLLRLTTQWIVTVGEAYWLKVSSRLQVPMELHPIPPTHIHPVLSGGVVSGYLALTGDGKPMPLDRDKVVRFYFPDPENVYGSEGYLGPGGITADSLKFASQHLRSHYENDATPKYVLKALEGAQGFSPEEKERFYTLWRQYFHARSGTKRGLPPILPTNYELVTMAVQTGADIVPLLQHWRDEQLMGFGVPRSILGQVVSGDRSSAETNQYVFDLHTISPLATLISEGITLQLAPDFDPSIFVEFEKFVSDDKEFTLRQETADLQNKVRSPQQILRDREADPEDAPWGELPVANIGQVPYDVDMLYGFEDDDQPEALGGPEPEEGKEEEPRAARQKNGGARPDPAAFGSKEEFMAACVPQVMAEGKTNEQAVGQCNGMWENRGRWKMRAGYFAPKAEWQRQVNREKKYVPTFLRAIRTIFRDQRISVLKKLEASSRIRISVPDLFQPDEWVNLFERRVEPIREKAFEAILGETLEGFGIDEFVLTDEMRFLLQQQGALLVKHANATTQNMIAAQLEKGTAEGESVDQLAKRIEGVFRVRRKHARTIARTEVLKASQEAQVAGFETSGVVQKKQWNTSMDAAVRDDHAAIEGQTVGLRETFVLGNGEHAHAPGVGPGHGQLSAKNSINCRCFVTPVLE